MASAWRNNGDPVDGLYIIDVDPEDGSQVQTFKGATVQEVTDKLANAQVNASRRINELRKDMTPDPKKPRQSYTPRQLTVDEKFQNSMDMNDPDKMDLVVSRVVEAHLGAPLDVVRRRLESWDEREIEEASKTQAAIFLNNTPEWNPTEENKLKLCEYMAAQNMEWTAKNFSIAFDKLTADGLLIPKPMEAEPVSPASERIAPTQTTRPRGSFSTGIRSSDTSGTPGTGKKPPPRYTRQQIDEMPKALFAQKMMSEAGFAETIDALDGLTDR